MSSAYLCRLCKVVKSEVNFYKHSRTRCKECALTVVKKHIEQINDDCRANASKHKERWDTDDVARMLDMADKGTHYRDIALALGRSYLAVHSKIDKVRKLLSEDAPSQPLQPRRDRNYVASAPDEDRWWDPDYYKKG